MRRVQIVFAFAVALGVLTGCPPTYPKCDNDDHCKDKGEVCVQGQCRECASDAQCKAGFKCDGNKCIPKSACTSAADCGFGKHCENGRCAEGECGKDGDCGSGKCVNSKCVAAAGTCASPDDCPSGEDCVSGRCVKGSGACNYSPIRFEFNKYNLSSDAENQLRQVADCLKKQKGKVTVEGHADERGTEEYNLQLSNRRAASVKRYLSDLGVGGSTVDTVGYGETRPAQSGSDEAAWAANRRVEFRR
jgi:peptidoglycan-associated lipoprotein